MKTCSSSDGRVTDKQLQALEIRGRVQNFLEVLYSNEWGQRAKVHMFHKTTFSRSINENLPYNQC